MGRKGGRSAPQPLSELAALVRARRPRHEVIVADVSDGTDILGLDPTRLDFLRDHLVVVLRRGHLG